MSHKHKPKQFSTASFHGSDFYNTKYEVQKELPKQFEQLLQDLTNNKTVSNFKFKDNGISYLANNIKTFGSPESTKQTNVVVVRNQFRVKFLKATWTEGKDNPSVVCLNDYPYEGYERFYPKKNIVGWLPLYCLQKVMPLVGITKTIEVKEKQKAEIGCLKPVPSKIIL